MMLRNILPFFCLLFTHLAVGQTSYYHGIATNYTAGGMKGDFMMMITCEQDQACTASIQWDNITLFGYAEMVASEQAYIDTAGTVVEYFQGTFDCSNVGGWPDNTESDFSTRIEFDQYGNPIKGVYRIIGNNRLVPQIGSLEFSHMPDS